MNQSLHQQRVAGLRLAIEQSGARAGWDHACAYLPGRVSTDLAMRVADLDPGVYHALMDLNFRRSGSIVYRPHCADCAQCRAIRVPTAGFTPNRSQRRCWKRHSGLNVRVSHPELTDEKHALYERYQRGRHDGVMGDSLENLREFLYESPVATREVTFRRRGELVAVGIVDVEPEALSTVYCFYAPDSPHDSLGVFNVLWTIEHARLAGIPHVYLGYYVHDCAKMNYKLRYRPCELLKPDGCWERLGPRDAHDASRTCAAGKSG